MKASDDILELERALLKLENFHASFDYLRITIASPTRIKSWAERTLPTGEIIGEVLKPETINFRTHQPEENGLFCEKIFGPIKNWRCSCGKYNGFVVDKICEDCQVEIIEARVRRYRMGYIDLTCPVTHLWYLKGVPSYLCLLLKCFDDETSLKEDHLKIQDLESLVYFRRKEKIIGRKNPLYRFFMPKENRLKKYFTSQQEVSQLSPNLNESAISFDNAIQKRKEKRKKFPKRCGAEIIKAALESINLFVEVQKLRSLLNKNALKNINPTWSAEKASLTQDKTLIRRIRIYESFLATKTNPGWMILTTLPVLPPNLRPLLELESGRLVAADVNEIYRLIITRNQRLSDFLLYIIVPEVITIHGRKLLQEGVDSLINNTKVAKNRRFCLNNKPLKSLTEILEGKQGRFRQSLLGKRVDYSGRSVIIVGPTLRLNQCGLPYEMGIELFQPFLINELLKTKIKAPSHNTKLAHMIIKKNKPFIWNLLILLTKKYSILLNRAPTLHRFGIQAFDPIIILGQAIHLHPLVCTGFNADFDGDQMAIHLPLYETSQLEARTMMRPSYNVLSPSNGEVILKPTQDMVIGCYYLTLMINKNQFLVKTWFSNPNQALGAFHQKKITMHTPILVRYPISDFKITNEKGKLKFFDTLTNLSVNEKEIIIQKVFPLKHSLNKYYLITNIGILIAQSVDERNYSITDLFLETTPGRLIFSINFLNSLTKLKHAY